MALFKRCHGRAMMTNAKKAETDGDSGLLSPPLTHVYRSIFIRDNIAKRNGDASIKNQTSG